MNVWIKVEITDDFEKEATKTIIDTEAFYQFSKVKIPIETQGKYKYREVTGTVTVDPISGDTKKWFITSPSYGDFMRMLENKKGICRGKSVYISGPMTGIDNYNFPAFDFAAKQLRDRGYNVYNPAENGVIEGNSYIDYLRVDIAAICQECDKICILPGAENSKGATIEIYVAKALGFEIVEVTK